MWTYSKDPSASKLDEVRFTIGDTDELYPLLQDEEITFTLTQEEENVIKASIRCCEAIIAKWTKEVTYKTESETVELTDRIESMQRLLQALQLRETKSCGVFPRVSEVPPIFRIGMNDYASDYKKQV